MPISSTESGPSDSRVDVGLAFAYGCPSDIPGECCGALIGYLPKGPIWNFMAASPALEAMDLHFAGFT